MNYHEIRQIDDIAKTVMARDYKGLSKIVEVNNEKNNTYQKNN